MTRVAWWLVQATGLVGLAVGMAVLSGTPIGADPAAALRAAAAELPLTLVPALLISAAATLNVCAGAVLFRSLLGVPLGGFAAGALYGLAGAVLLDLSLMTVLGLVGLFRLPILIAISAAIVAFGWWRGLRPRFDFSRDRLTGVIAADVIGLTLVALVWAGPLILALASPVVPFNDVPPNHVAPVEHLRVFGSLTALDATFSPIYGPSRIFLGYQALVGTLATMADVPGATAVAGFAVPLAVLVAIGGWALARAIGGARAGLFALVLVPMSVTFLRLGDARAGVLGFPVVAAALLLLIEPRLTTPRRNVVALTLALAAALYAHPLVGLLGTATVGIAAFGWPRRYAALALPAAIAAPLVALPQWAAMIGIDWAAATLVVGVPAAAGVIVVLESVRVLPLRESRILPAVLVAIAAAVVLAEVLSRDIVSASLATAAQIVSDFPVLIAAVSVALIASWRSLRHLDLILAAVLATIFAGILSGLVGGGGVLTSSLGYEVAKSISYFAPTLVVVVAAAGLGALWAKDLSGTARAAATVVVALLVTAVAMPIAVPVATAFSLGEHRLSEILSIQLRTAARGYWLGYPDPRRLIDDKQRELIAALRAEVSSGRLTGTTNVLHIAKTWRSDVAPSYATPLGVFAGVVETTATTDPEVSANTIGGRLFDIKDLDTMLGPAFPYAVVEGGGLPADPPDRLAAAGYTQVWSNSKAAIYRLSQ